MGYRFIFLLLLFVFAHPASSQLLVEKTSHDFGDVGESTNRTVDFQIVNNYKFSIIQSTFLFDFELNTTYAPVSVEPGDTLLYRVRINPKKTGPFERTIALSFYHLSDTVFLNLKANVLTTDFKDNAPLEQLRDKPSKYDEPFKDHDVRLKIVDATTGKPIPNASISFSSISPSYKSLTTDKNGEAMRVLHNRYNVSVYATGYKTAKAGISVGCNDSVRTIEMVKKGPNDKSEYEYLYEYEGANPITVEDSLITLNDQLTEEDLLEPLEKGNYKPNNIVFLMDVSISMKDHNRMNLLKAAIIQLVELLRPQDNVSIITFSENTKTVVVPTYLTSDNRKDVITIINALKPGGLTNGGKGLKVAFKLIRENYDASKNNQVILATDGALGSYMKHDDMVKLVDKNRIYATTSVVTLNGYNWSGKFMREIVKAGNGDLIPINNITDSKSRLVRVIKSNSIID